MAHSCSVQLAEKRCFSEKERKSSLSLLGAASSFKLDADGSSTISLFSLHKIYGFSIGIL